MMDKSAISIDGVQMREKVQPVSLNNLCELMVLTRPDAVYPMGGGSMLHLGLPPSRPGYIIDTTRLDRVDDYPSADLTITVECGITIDRLQALLRREKQMLAIDVPFPERATLGGAIAVNASGPRRFGYGTFRDAVLGIDVIDGEGKRIHGGGRVVKNVAGYDLMKLHTGALGTLGVIGQVTLKLRPRSASQVALAIPFSAIDDASKALSRLNTSDSRPVGLDLLGANATASILKGLTPEVRSSTDLAACLVLLFEDHPDATRWQCEKVIDELQEVGHARTAEIFRIHGEEYHELLRRLTEWPHENQASVAFRASILPEKVPQWFELAIEGTQTDWLAHAGTGVVHGRIDRSDGNEGTLRDALLQMDRQARACGGYLAVTRCPLPWKPTMNIWGSPRADAHWMLALKQALDPCDRINPGRFVTSAWSRTS